MSRKIIVKRILTKIVLPTTSTSSSTEYEYQRVILIVLVLVINDCFDARYDLVLISLRDSTSLSIPRSTKHNIAVIVSLLELVLATQYSLLSTSKQWRATSTTYLQYLYGVLEYFVRVCNRSSRQRQYEYNYFRYEQYT